MKAIHAIISGRVQGIGFRMATKHRAEIQNVRGWVKNLPDRTVEVYAEGEVSDVEHFKVWLKKGCLLSRVDKTQFDEVSVEGMKEFEIKY